jgi:hypothetical protein
VQKELERKKKRADLMCKRNYRERKKERSKARVARRTHIAQIMVLRRVPQKNQKKKNPWRIEAQEY